jgi:hypothetical protein
MLKCYTINVNRKKVTLKKEKLRVINIFGTHQY